MLADIEIVRHPAAAVKAFAESDGLQLHFEVVGPGIVNAGQVLCMTAVLQANQRPFMRTTINEAMQHAICVPCHNDRRLTDGG